MLKTGRKKIILVLVAAVILVAGAVVAIILLNRQESYRVIKVVELQGTAIVGRESTGELPAYVGMNLQSGDRLELDEISTATIMLDDDKYILLEPGTVLVIEAYGNPDENQTTVTLEEGAILNTITEKLGENSSYTVNVPNAVMAVRGTCYRVAVNKTDDGKYEISLEVFTGDVESQLLDDDGKKIDSPVNHGKDTYTLIYTDDNDDASEPIEPYYAVLDDEVDYDTIPDEVVKVIMDVYYSGHAPLQETVKRLVERGNPTAVNYVIEHDYQPTGTNTGTAPDLGEVTAVNGSEPTTDNSSGGEESGEVTPEGGESGSEESGSEEPDGSVSDEQDVSGEQDAGDGSDANSGEDDEKEPVGSDGTGLTNENDDTEGGDGNGQSDSSDGSGNNGGGDVENDGGNSGNQPPQYPSGGGNNLINNANNGYIGGSDGGIQPVYTETTTSVSYTAIFVDPDGNEITKRN